MSSLLSLCLILVSTLVFPFFSLVLPHVVVGVVVVVGVLGVQRNRANLLLMLLLGRSRVATLLTSPGDRAPPSTRP